MPDPTHEDDWTRSPARALAGIVLAALLGIGLLMGAVRAPLAQATPAQSVHQPRRIDVNTAPASELDLLPRIGPARAAAIVAEREAHGPYRTLDDLQRVKGIGPRTVEGIRAMAIAGAHRDE